MTLNFIPISQPSITDKEIKYVTDAVSSGWVSSLGEYINRFEVDFARFCGTRYALTTSNGTSALHLTLAALGIGPDDEVVIPDLTFVATASAISYLGAKVVFADIDENTLCLSPESLRASINSNTKAIVAVHLYGHPANMCHINAIAEEYGLFVIEDCAEAHGAEIDGQRVGSFSDAGVFSFYGNKVITTGEGGMITTDDETLYKKMKHLRDHAMDKGRRYWHSEVGFNYRMTNLQAALGVAQLERVDEILDKKRKIFSWYLEGLGGVDGVRLNYTEDGCKNVYWMVCLEIIGICEEKRDRLLDEMKGKGVDGRPYFYPVSMMPAYVSAETRVSHKVYGRGVNLPSYFDLTKKEVFFVCDVLKELIPSVFEA